MINRNQLPQNKEICNLLLNHQRNNLVALVKLLHKTHSPSDTLLDFSLSLASYYPKYPQDKIYQYLGCILPFTNIDDLIYSTTLTPLA